MSTTRIAGLTRLLLATVFALTIVEGLAENSAPGGSRTVQVSVSVMDSSGGRLHYRWHSTDGSIENIDAPSTAWRLPGGPGQHYAYVLVSNGLGGYSERRIAVNTDDMPGGSTSSSDDSEYSTLSPPPAPAQGNGDYFRGFIATGTSRTVDHDVYAPRVLVYLQDLASQARYPATGAVTTNLRGEYVIPGVPEGTYDVQCSLDAGATYQSCYYGVPMLNTATPWFDVAFAVGNTINGTFVLRDGSPCGVQDEFFGLHSEASATLLNANNSRIAGPVAVNEFGDFSLPRLTGAATVSLRCEHAQPMRVQVPPANSPFGDIDVGVTTLTGVSAPLIIGMTAMQRGKSVGKFLPPPTSSDPAHPFASDALPRAHGFLAVKGIDSRASACHYYKAVGAVEGCDEVGNFQGAVLTYAAWQRSQRIGLYGERGVPQYTADYINRADLNLARHHISISYGPNDTAAVVCNHLGPPATTPDQLLNPSQSDIDTAVLNAVNDRNLVACVAMDYAAIPGVNNGQPFVRFLIFGPSGALLPSVNLDGRSEKFVPGTCVACHGGDHYQGQFPADGSGFANIGGHFLPYDTGNFEFAQARGLTGTDQEEAIYNLNQNVLRAGPTVAETELIAGWYKNSHVLDQNYLPESWRTPSDPNADPKTQTGQAVLQTYKDFYLHVIARGCRSCHAGLIDAYNFDHEQLIDESNYQTQSGPSPLFIDPDDEFQRSVCGGKVSFGRDHLMPNSLVTFNRLWNSFGSSEDQVTYLNNYLALAVNIPNIATSYACGSTPSTP